MALLDTYSGAGRAWSVRRLRNAYSGSCIRVRRSSDNTEQDIGFVSDYIDTAAIASFCSGTDGFVTTVYGQDTTGFNATQTTQANQPRICSGGVVDVRGAFAGFANFVSSDLFTFTSYDMAGGGLNIMSVFGVVFANGTIAANPLAIMSGGNVTLGIRLQTSSTNTTSLYVKQTGQADYFNSSTFASNKIIQLTVIQKVGNTTGWIDGSQVGTTTSSAASFGINNLGFEPTTSNYYNDVMFEIVMYSADKTSDRAAIEADQIAYFTPPAGGSGRLINGCLVGGILVGSLA